ncbi:MAG: hypothetical protein WKG06_01270 [Segetibacter sp.]
MKRRVTKAEGITDNVGELNKSKYNVSIEDAALHGGEEFKKERRLSVHC